MTEQSIPHAASCIVVDGANELSGIRSVWWIVRHWHSLRDEMVASPGYLKHRISYSFPYTLIVTSWWADEKSAYKFAHQPVHLRFWKWASRNPKNTNGGWLAIYRYEKGGPLWGNGVKAMYRGLETVVSEPTNSAPQLTPKDRKRQKKPES